MLEIDCNRAKKERVDAFHNVQPQSFYVALCISGRNKQFNSQST
ncbi:hypothetical protein VCRA2120O389_70068 [Vibrio crassostreae]|nr:hypothetical protein VCRA2113O356_70067 [Vibrio crassostreae]CAK2547483.1 hypothetical protein VCRA2116O373_60068 [Vibrio crassostreae]CAK2557496.1 hypothetical protein VCRA2113O364_70067 [Vibrio crassostreae]CAK3167382.1 hypothetical protein VCRA2133O401_70067 [Vibrio crassostreae]CAK3188762.1 hypothetical protein VCRA2133O403_80068 [Vibrio crassostreae]